MVSGSGVPSGGAMMVWTYTFKGVPLKDVKEFRVVARRVQQFEFPDVVLEPKGKLPEAKPLRFSKPLWTSWREGTAGQAALPRKADQPGVDSWIDLDSDRGETFSGKPAEVEAQARRSGCDVAINADKFLALDTRFALVPDSAFAEFTPQQVINSVYRGRFAPRELKPVNADGTGVTFTYETREGGFGILQLTRTATGSWPDGFRWKRVER